MPRKTTLKGASIVVADDHVDSADLLAMVLESAGADVRTGNTAAEVVDLVRSGSFTPDLLLLDITLPDMDGYELLAALRHVDASAGTPALAVTGHASEKDKARSAEAGFVAHVTKPFDNDALVLVLGALLAIKAGAAPVSRELANSETVRARLAERGVSIAASQAELLAHLAPVLQQEAQEAHEASREPRNVTGG